MGQTNYPTCVAAKERKSGDNKNVNFISKQTKQKKLFPSLNRKQ